MWGVYATRLLTSCLTPSNALTPGVLGVTSCNIIFNEAHALQRRYPGAFAKPNLSALLPQSEQVCSGQAKMLKPKESELSHA